MKYTDLYKFPYPGDVDTGALALAMQALAEKVDTELWDEAELINGAANAVPMWIKTYSLQWDVPADNLFEFSLVPLDTVIYTNIAEPLYTSSTPLYRTGAWLLGWTGTWTAVGAVNVGTYRISQIDQRTGEGSDPPPDGPSGFSRYLMSTETEGTSGAGPEGHCMEKVFTVSASAPAGTGGAYAWTTIGFNHGNTSSSLRFAAGTMRAWGVWLGDDRPIPGGV